MATSRTIWTVNDHPIMGADEPKLWPPVGFHTKTVRERDDASVFVRREAVQPTVGLESRAEREKAFARLRRTVSRWYDRLTGKMQLDDVVWHHGMGEPAADPPSVYLEARTMRALMKQAK